MERPWKSTGLGWVLAFLVLIAVLIATVFNVDTPDWLIWALIGMLSLAWLV